VSKKERKDTGGRGGHGPGILDVDAGFASRLSTVRGGHVGERKCGGSTETKGKACVNTVKWR